MANKNEKLDINKNDILAKELDDKALQDINGGFLSPRTEINRQTRPTTPLGKHEFDTV